MEFLSCWQMKMDSLLSEEGNFVDFHKSLMNTNEFHGSFGKILWCFLSLKITQPSNDSRNMLLKA